MQQRVRDYLACFSRLIRSRGRQLWSSGLLFYTALVAAEVYLVETRTEYQRMLSFTLWPSCCACIVRSSKHA